MHGAPRSVEVLAHRGASKHAPEHTLAAYDLALAQGADALEVDVRALADGELVVVHDSTLWRTSRDPRAVGLLCAADLAALPEEHRPLTLATVLGRYAGRTGLVLDLKDPAPPMERRLVCALAERHAVSHIVVQAFDIDGLRRVRALDGSVAIAPLCDRVPEHRDDWLDDLAAWGADGIGVHHAAVDAALVLAARARGLAVRAWTVNDAGEAARLAGIDVDGVITDVPAEMRAAMASHDGAPALAA